MANVNGARRGAARSAGIFAFAASVFAACDTPPRYWVCDELSSARLHALPAKLSETGLFADSELETLGPGVTAYAPRFALWSDGAEKRRWFKLPDGTRIDAGDMDAWIFPEGTQFWKEFTRDGVRVETRLLQKIGPRENDWMGMAYLWSADQREAHAAPYGAIDAHGTAHNVPAASECMACHGGSKSRVLGFSAIQLAEDALPFSLQAAVDSGLLTQEPEDVELPLPGTATEQAALGYLHANCSHCHNQERPGHAGARCYEPDNKLDLKLRVSDLSKPEDTATYRSMESVIKPGHPGKSELFERFSQHGFFKHMPPLATERIDQDAVALLRAWISGL